MIYGEDCKKSRIRRPDGRYASSGLYESGQPGRGCFRLRPGAAESISWKKELKEGIAE